MSHSKPFFAALSVFLLPASSVYEGIQLIVGFCVNLDAEPLMTVVVVFN